ncbi:MFS transporter [Labedella endophytica]|uniref:MFS transporter n=1 Tax=Labedella endophytica TaxID=1523160 RepID=A0A3S1CQH1_9MICO|nr:MFS transporter [Labedella endophytica]RUQ98964.1 MFS transporter [Labedella endophytica]
MTTSPDRSFLTPTGSIPSGARFPWWGMIALSVATFLSVTSEMMPTGLLPEMSADLGVTEASVGLLVTVFAFTVVVSSAPLTAVTLRIPRKPFLLGVIALLGLANLLTALAPDYTLVVASRILGGLAHGLFWSTVPAYAARLVPKDLIARAVSVTIAGGTLAFVLGVPLGTALGQAIGWRWGFVAVAIAFAIGVVAVGLLLPGVGPAERRAPHRAADGRRSLDPTALPVALVCLTVAVVMIGHYAIYTYIAPFMTQEIGIDPSLFSVVLFGYGIAGAAGLVLSGTVFARRPSTGLVAALAGSALFVTIAALAVGNTVVAIIAVMLWGVAFGMIPPLMQTRVLQVASTRIRDTAAAFYTTAFNVGIGGGALVGAWLLETGGLGALPPTQIVLTVLGLVIVVLVGRGRASRRS